MHPTLTIAQRAAQAAAKVILRNIDRLDQLTVSEKGRHDFVSEVDVQAEREIVKVLRKTYPDHAILAEESGAAGESDYQWIIDPLDGTTNFLHGLPHWCITVALEKDGEIVAGVIHDPIKHETFTAEKGGGAFSDKKRMRVAGRASLADALVSLDGRDFDMHLPHSSIRRMGSACLNLAYVAAGRLDAYVEPRLFPWDKAAGALMIKEAGGIVTELDGGKNPVHGKGIVASNATLHAELLRILKGATAKTAS